MIEILGKKCEPPFYYTGIGPPSTPPFACKLFSKVAGILSRAGGVLRSGGEEGGDSAFEESAKEKQIFLPYPHFNKNTSEYSKIDLRCFDLIKEMHPAWHRCSEFAKKSHARHCYEILGPNLDDPSSFVICWTEDGVSDYHKVTGKTGMLRTAIALALKNNIPVINIGNIYQRQIIEDFVASNSIISKGAVEQVAAESRGAQPSRPKKGFQTLRR